MHQQKPPVYTTESGFSSEKVFCCFSYWSEQRHIINPLLISLTRSVWESITFGFIADLAPSVARPVRPSHSAIIIALLLGIYLFAGHCGIRLGQLNRCLQFVRRVTGK